MVAIRVALPLLAALVLLAPASAAERPRVDAVRATGPIRVDGVLDEPDWQRAAPIRDLRLIFVREGQVPSESTDVRVLFDDAKIYFGIRCENRGPGAIRASVTPRDGIEDDDFIAVNLDTYHDFHRAYVFGVNPFGVQLDGILTGDDMNLDWDGVWDAEAERDSLGWSAEIAVPLRILRFPDAGPGVWGLWIRRTITKNDEIASWPLWKQSVAGDIMLQAADLGGLAGLTGGGRVEVQPYAATTQSAWRLGDRFTAPGPWERDADNEVGLDVKFAPTATLVLNGTVNPDYSQVEADALQFDVNLRFPLYYTEKRPFFLEGADYFKTPIDLVYTRRIANPDYGLKATGTIGHVRVGGLVARDAGGASLEGIGDGPSEGLSQRGTYEIGRVSVEIGEQSDVGVLLAGHQVDAGSAPPGDLTGVTIPGAAANLVVAGDWRVRLAKPLFLRGQVARSATHADTTAFAIFPGDTLAAVPGRSSAAGVAYWNELSWSDGIRTFELTHEYFGPGFRSESGFIERTDFRRTGLEAEVTVRPENAWIRSWEPILEADLYHDPDGPLQEWYVSPMVDWEFQKQSHVHTMVEFVSERWHGTFYDQRHYILNADNSLWRALAVGFTTFTGDGIFYAPTAAESYLGWVGSYGVTATWRPSPRVTSQIAVTRNLFWRSRGGARVYDIWQTGAKTTLQFTRRFYARIYPQYDSGTEHLQADGLLGYVVHPGTVFYLGVNSGLDPLPGGHRETSRSVFAKASYAWVR